MVYNIISYILLIICSLCLLSAANSMENNLIHNTSKLSNDEYYKKKINYQIFEWVGWVIFCYTLIIITINLLDFILSC